MTVQTNFTEVPSGGKQFWLRRLALGAALVLLLGLLGWFLVRGGSSVATSKKGSAPPPAQVQVSQNAPGAPRATGAAPVESSAALKNQLEQVISEVKEANQKKDLSLLLSHYSPNFPQLTQRAQTISKNWKIYDYPNMSFELKDVKLLPDKTAAARVIWEVETQNISTRKSQISSKTYLVRFARESGQWRIKALDNAE